jgi:hypothetical protein
MKNATSWEGPMSMKLVNLSRENFRAANSSKYGLYFSLVWDVCLLLNSTGWICVTSFPFGNTVVCCCNSIPVKYCAGLESDWRSMGPDGLIWKGLGFNL